MKKSQIGYYPGDLVIRGPNPTAGYNSCVLVLDRVVRGQHILFVKNTFMFITSRFRQNENKVFVEEFTDSANFKERRLWNELHVIPVDELNQCKFQH